MTGSEFMPLQVGKLFQSDFWLMANRLERLAALTLWSKSWHQVPAGSIPDNDRVLAGMSEMGEDWATVREMALYGWVKCSDGRLYHPVVCEAALVAYVGRLGYQLSSGMGNRERWGTPFDPWPLVDRINECNLLLLALNPASEKTLKINVGKLPARDGAAQDVPQADPQNPVGIGSGSGRDRKIKVKDKGKDKEEEKYIGGKPPITPSADAPAGEGATGESGERAADGLEVDLATGPREAPKKPPVQPIPGLEIPDWMPRQQWDDFVDMRRKMGKSIPFTPAAAKGIVRELGVLRDQGQEPALVLQQSVNNGYRGVFAVKNQSFGRAPSRDGKYAAAGRSLYGGGQAAGSEGVIDV